MSLDRRTTLKWMFAAAAAVPSLSALAYTPEPFARDVAKDQPGYGTDPDLVKEWQPGGPWPLTLGVAARLTTAALCDLIIPADDHSPSASSVGVVEFIDEWISAPYPQQRADREVILPGLQWIEAESQKRFNVSAMVDGGGMSGQAGAVQHGIARALIVADLAMRPVLKKHGLLTRDPRMKERKKPGLKRARKAPQYTKR